MTLLRPAEELALAKASPDGMWLSPAAQALYEQEGSERFRAHHGAVVRAAAAMAPAKESEHG